MLHKTALEIDDDGSLSGELAFALDAERDVSLVVRVTGALGIGDEPSLLAEHTSAIALVPRGDAAVALAADDLTTKSVEGVNAFRFDVNRNGRSNSEDLVAGCPPGVPAPAMLLSATDLQLSSGVEPGAFVRQVLVLDNVTGADIEYWLRVVGAPGVGVSALDVDALESPVPQTSLGDESATLSLPPGQEALVAVTFAPSDSTLTTGFLIV